MSQALEQAKLFLEKANKYGFTIEVKSPSVVAIHKRFTPGDASAYVECDCAGSSVLSYAPLKGGSEWGTDGGSIGGAIGMKNGYYTLNKSGEGKRFTAALKKLLA